MTGPCEYCGHQTFEVTAYTAGPESTGKRPGDPGYGITASGAPVREGHTLACPPEMPFGTRVYIPHFGRTFTCEDRGGAIRGNRLDVYMESVEDARQFGRRELKAEVIGVLGDRDIEFIEDMYYTIARAQMLSYKAAMRLELARAILNTENAESMYRNGAAIHLIDEALDSLRTIEKLEIPRYENYVQKEG